MSNPRNARKARARKRKQRQPRGGVRSRGANVLAPGAGAVTRNAFGGASTLFRSLACWDAKSPVHLPLPRATGPYTVVRVTRRFSNNARVLLFGTFHRKGHDATDGPSSICCIRDVGSELKMNAPNNAYYYASDLAGIGQAATVVPSAFSLQVMNPNALQTTHGIVYGGVMNTQAAVCDRDETWTAYANKFVEFQNPRILTAPKLALRGVQINSYPLNMSALSDFEPLTGHGLTEGALTWDNATGVLEPRGFAPIVIYNATDDVPPMLEYLVTTEYRVRFDLDNIASASHKHHPVASDRCWADLMSRATSLGNGVIDIVEGVANMGQMINRGARRFGGARAAEMGPLMTMD